MGSLVVSVFAEHYILLFRCAFFAVRSSSALEFFGTITLLSYESSYAPVTKASARKSLLLSQVKAILERGIAANS